MQTAADARRPVRHMRQQLPRGAFARPVGMCLQLVDVVDLAAKVRQHPIEFALVRGNCGRALVMTQPFDIAAQLRKHAVKLLLASRYRLVRLLVLQRSNISA